MPVSDTGWSGGVGGERNTGNCDWSRNAAKLVRRTDDSR